jgi:hypothetical protein
VFIDPLGASKYHDVAVIIFNKLIRLKCQEKKDSLKLTLTGGTIGLCLNITM